MKKLTLVILLVAILFSFSSANAEKEPTWTYVSTDGITDVSISEDSGNTLNENKDKTDNHFYSPV